MSENNRTDGPMHDEEPIVDKNILPEKEAPITDIEEYEYVDDAKKDAARPGEPKEDAAALKARQAEEQKKKSKMQKVLRVVISLVVILGISVFLAFQILTSVDDVFAITKPDHAVKVQIAENLSDYEIGKTLQEAGVINKPIIYWLYAQLKRDDDEPYQSGEFLLNSSMPYNELIYTLTNPPRSLDTVQVMIPEGYTVRQIADSLEENSVCDAEAFIEMLNEGEFGYAFEDEIPHDKNRWIHFEGYLFPDTYEFYVDEDVRSVILRFLDNFNSKVTLNYYERMDELGLTLDQTITLASIIQKEAGQENEMGLVSSVFHNRLDDKVTFPHLQSDVTIFYVEENIKPYIDIQNQEMYDAYNTYVCEGLSVGPVCNPGIAAIRSALYPEDTDYYYFLTDDEGQYYYAKTLEEHEANIAAAEEIGEVHGTGTSSQEEE
ncbi:endolytic transglycosylase MltG [Candidatus Soleaferrea massiliensis]|uniref:endolytic transglycosylase MltG n=1 Tax=Candidatus Soleaferrea massiliensis TaxID=1470354 RepID=UPI000693F22C|nr:endolytic transglycosylase MltG [Candidatus Soleaferrea massiliensis]